MALLVIRWYQLIQAQAVNYEFIPATLKNTTLAIKLTSDCGFSVESKSCSYEDENGCPYSVLSGEITQ